MSDKAKEARKVKSVYGNNRKGMRTKRRLEKRRKDGGLLNQRRGMQ